MRAMGIDPGTAICGFGVIDADGLAMAIYAIYSSHSMSLKRKVQL